MGMLLEGGPCTQGHAWGLTVCGCAIGVLEGAGGVDLVDGAAQLQQLAARPALNAMAPARPLRTKGTAIVSREGESWQRCARGAQPSWGTPAG